MILAPLTVELLKDRHEASGFAKTQESSRILHEIRIRHGFNLRQTQLQARAILRSMNQSNSMVAVQYASLHVRMLRPQSHNRFPDVPDPHSIGHRAQNPHGIFVVASRLCFNFGTRQAVMQKDQAPRG